MTRHDYTVLDAAILDAIAFGKSDFTQIQGHCATNDEAARLEAADKTKTRANCYIRKPANRFIDARLQALRRAGKIVYAKGHWSIV